MVNKIFQFIPNLYDNVKKMTKVGLNISFNKFYHNRIVLYIFFLLSLVYLFFCANTGDYKSVSIFVLVGFLTSFFNKNMLIILIIALVITHVLKFGMKGMAEGMEDKMEKEELKEIKDNELLDTKEEKQETMANKETDKKQNEPIPETDKKKDFAEFQKIQSEIMDTMKNLEPLIVKAENFVDKFQEKYSSKK